MSTTPPRKPDKAASTPAKPPASKAAPADSAPRLGPRAETNPDAKGKTSADAKADPVEIKRDIERTREELGNTAEELAHKVDVPARVKHKVHDTTETVQTKAEQGKHQAQAKAQQALAKLPPPARERVEQLSTTAQQRPVLTVLVALTVGMLLGRLLRRNQ